MFNKIHVSCKRYKCIIISGVSECVLSNTYWCNNIFCKCYIKTSSYASISSLTIVICLSFGLKIVVSMLVYSMYGTIVYVTFRVFYILIVTMKNATVMSIDLSAVVLPSTKWRKPVFPESAQAFTPPDVRTNPCRHAQTSWEPIIDIVNVASHRLADVGIPDMTNTSE